MDANQIKNLHATPFVQTYFHGTKAELNIGDTIEAGFLSNYGDNPASRYVFMTATLDAAIWGAEFAAGEGKGKIYLVEPTGPIENDPDLTDRKFPGNPTMSFRSQSPLRVIGVVMDWQGHEIQKVEEMKNALEELRKKGIKSLNEE